MQQLERPADTNDYLDAFYKLKRAKNWLLALLLIALVGNLAAALTVRLTPVLDDSASFRADLAAVRGDAPPDDAEPAEPAPPEERVPFELPRPATQNAQDEPSATQPTPKPAPPGDDEPAPFEALQSARTDEPFTSEPDEGPPLVDGEQVYTMLVTALPIARAVGLLAAMLLTAVLLVSLAITLLGRLSGVAYLTSALLWSLLLAVMLVPWNLAFEGFGLPSALFSGPELVEGTSRVLSTANVGWAVELVYWLRFVAYPAAALLVWLAVLIQYRRGFRPVVTSASE